MENNEAQVPAAEAVEAPKAPVKPKRRVAKPRVNAKPKVKAAPKKNDAPKAKAPMVNPHIEAGVQIGMYTGPSSMINANRKTKVRMLPDLAPAKLTDRMKKSLYALRDRYDGKAFTVRGFDNGIIAHLAAAKMISLKGGQIETIDGYEYMLDGATGVTANITAAGKNYGKA